MSFILTRKKAGNTLELNNGGGTLKVLSGKVKAHTIKAKKDDGTIKKGDNIEGVEFAINIVVGNNIEAQKYQQAGAGEKYGKYVPDTDPLPATIEVTLFVPKNAGGLGYLAFFDNCEKLGLPAGLKDGFAGTLNIGESAYTEQMENGDFTTKIPSVLLMLLDDAAKVDCAIEFSAPYVASTFGGKSGQSEVDKLNDRMKFIEGLLTDSSPEQKLFVKLLGLDGEITHREYIALMFN